MYIQISQFFRMQVNSQSVTSAINQRSIQSIIYFPSLYQSFYINMWLLLEINVLFTTSFGASNSTIQCLSAPVREEIDKGHRERATFNIGISSLKTLVRISRRRLIPSMILALSSIPVLLLQLQQCHAGTYSIYESLYGFSHNARNFGWCALWQFDVVMSNPKKSPRTSLSRDLILHSFSYEKKDNVHQGYLLAIIIYPSCGLNSYFFFFFDRRCNLGT